MLEKYPSKVKLVHKNFPIRSHKFAFKAALAALAAGQQGKFWEFHDALYKNYNRLNDAKIEELAKQLNLDQTEFKKQQTNSKIVAQVRQDYEEGIRIGIRGVPTVFINGKKMRDRSMQSLEAAINNEIEKAAAVKGGAE